MAALIAVEGTGNKCVSISRRERIKSTLASTRGHSTGEIEGVLCSGDMLSVNHKVQKGVIYL